MADLKTTRPDRNGDAVKSTTGQETAPMVAPRDREFMGNIRGQSPVSGLDSDSDWENCLMDIGETVSTGSGVDTTIGRWPIQNYGNAPKQRSV